MTPRRMGAHLIESDPSYPPAVGSSASRRQHMIRSGHGSHGDRLRQELTNEQTARRDQPGALCAASISRVPARGPFDSWRVERPINRARPPRDIGTWNVANVTVPPRRSPVAKTSHAENQN